MFTATTTTMALPFPNNKMRRMIRQIPHSSSNDFKLLSISGGRRSILFPERGRHHQRRGVSCCVSASKAPSLQEQNKQQQQLYNTSSPSPPDPATFPPWSYEPRSYFKFEILHQSSISSARVGRIHTPHGIIDTPSYVAVATNAALKGVDIRDADTVGQQLIFCNTYHLLLQPGTEVVEGAGGLHEFMNRKNGPLITDSGGFQVFSLAYGSVHEELSTGGELKRRNAASKGKNGSLHMTTEGRKGKPPVKVTEEGAIFRSYRDGKSFLLTPESTVQAQKSFGADIIIPLDELPPYHIDRNVLVKSVERTHRWEARSLREHLLDVKEQAMYCVIHGGLDRELRKKSVDYLTSLPFDVRKKICVFFSFLFFALCWVLVPHQFVSSIIIIYSYMHRVMQLEAAWARIAKS
jgi:hypothetical protein